MQGSSCDRTATPPRGFQCLLLTRTICPNHIDLVYLNSARFKVRTIPMGSPDSHMLEWSEMSHCTSNLVIHGRCLSLGQRMPIYSRLSCLTSISLIHFLQCTSVFFLLFTLCWRQHSMIYISGYLPYYVL